MSAVGYSSWVLVPVDSTHCLFWGGLCSTHNVFGTLEKRLSKNKPKNLIAIGSNSLAAKGSALRLLQPQADKHPAQVTLHRLPALSRVAGGRAGGGTDGGDECREVQKEQTEREDGRPGRKTFQHLG